MKAIGTSLCLLFLFSPATALAQAFTDVASSAGVNDSGRGRGVAWGDYDGDGDIDLYVAQIGSANLLYQNNGNGTFTDVAASSGVNDSGNGWRCVWGDYDNDGDLDLYLTNTTTLKFFQKMVDNSFRGILLQIPVCEGVMAGKSWK